jgi:hypothetical protein
MASTPLLGLALPADGITNWGTLVNTSITALLDSAVAATTTISSISTPYTLTTTVDAANEARQAVILCTGATTGVQTIIAPAQSKTYVLINATTNNFGVKIVGVGPTTGVTVPNGRAYMVAWNGSDFVITGITTVNLATDVTGTLPIANGGTGQITQQLAINALVGTQTANRVLRSDGTNSSLAQVALATDVTGTLAIANGGTNSTAAAVAGGAVYSTATAYAVTTAGTSGQVLTSAGASAPAWASLPTNVASITFGTTGLTPSTATTGAVTVAGTLAIANGGTGQTTAAGAITSLGATTVGGNMFTLTNPSAITFPRFNADNTVSALSDANFRTAIGSTTVGGNMFTLTNPSAITFPRFNADNTVSALNAADFRTAIGAGTGGGTVTSVTGSAPVASTGGAAPQISLNAGYGDTQNPYASKTANFVLAAPNGAAGVPGFRALVAADIPTLNQNTTGTAAGLSATLAVASGGTGVTVSTGTGSVVLNNAPTLTSVSVTGGAVIESMTVGRGGTSVASNTAVGSSALTANTSGSLNTAVGFNALAANTIAAGNTAVGYGALAANTVGASNSAFGYNAMALMTGVSSGSNVAVGREALTAITGSASRNVGIGTRAAASKTGGSSCVAIGYESAYLHTTGGSFVCIGDSAAYSSTDQLAGTVAIGTQALYTANTDSSNPAIFNRRNVAVGASALYALDALTYGDGSNNTAIGYNAGIALLGGSNNIIIGSLADASSTVVSNEITLGNSSITTLRCQVTSITSLSDERDKHSIEDLPVGLALINALRPRRYKWDKRDWYIDEVELEDGVTDYVPVPQDGSRAQNDWNEGFVAQEAKAALEAAGASWFPLVYETNPEKLEMSAGKLIPVLVKAIQELTARLEALEAK